jgi:hypothetical protein
MSETELKLLKDYIDDMLGKGFIRPSSSNAGAPVLFAKNPNGSLRLCVDYRGLNRITKKNRYPIPLINDLIDRLKDAQVYTKIDLRAGYNNIRIAPGHEYKTAFRTRYGLFEYLVMPFGMTNSPATFQYFMNDIFHDMTDVFVIIYLDDILIFSTNLEDHRVHVKKVLERLREHNLHAKPEKCKFHTSSVEYLGVIITPEGVRMDPKKVQAIIQWPAPRKVKELQSFLGFANFYRRFIDNYSGITKPLNNLLRGNAPWKWTEQCEDVFQLLKKAFTSAPILRLFDPTLPIILECDASDFAIAAIISQFDIGSKDLRPVAFYTRSMVDAELNYDIYDKELLAIVEAFKQWRAYLEGASYPVQVYSDHNNLQYFTTTKLLSRRQARWSEYLSEFDFHIHYRPGRLGEKPDALTRRPDVYPKKTFTSTNSLIPKILIPPERLNATLLMNEELFLTRLRRTPRDDYFVQKETLAANADAGFTLSPDKKLLLRQGKIYIPDHKNLRLEVLQNHHDHPLRGHQGIRKTVQLIMRSYFWPGLRRDVTRYIRTCHVCIRAKTPRHKPYGLLKPLPIGERPWSSISIDHIVELPKSEDHDAIMVTTCRLTKGGIFIPNRTTDDAEDFAEYFMTHVFAKHGLPCDIVSDRGPLFISKFWTALCKSLGIKLNLSTAYHPETDGQTERLNQTLEQYIRMFTNYLQDDWKRQLPIAEFTYNNTPHSATGVSPFFANKGFHPRLSISFDNIPSHEARLVAADLKDLHNHLKQEIKTANDTYQKFANVKRDPTPDWPVGTLVWLKTENIKTKRPSVKLDHRMLGPFKIIKKVSTHAYKLALPPSMSRIHNVFHVKLLERHHTEYFPRRRMPPPPPIEIDGEEQYEVEDILDSRIYRGKLQYRVRWVGHEPQDDTWEPTEHVANAELLVRQFHATYPEKPKP